MKRLRLGGQAVIEGIMLKSENFWALGTRNFNDDIEVQTNPLNPSKLNIFWKMPFIRGTKALVDAIGLGFKALTISAQKAAETENKAGEIESELSTGHMVIAIGSAVIAAVVLFIVLPAFFVKFLYTTSFPNFLINLIEGIIKVGILVGYIASISLMSDIKRIFEYHGAEHAVIHIYEMDEELVASPEMAKNIRHVRCGTSFLMLVMIVSIFIFSLLGRPPFFERVLYHLAIIPLVAGVSYEIIRFAGNHQNNKFVRLIMIPGLTLQRLTTRIPDNEQLEVAIETLKELVRLEESRI